MLTNTTCLYSSTLLCCLPENDMSVAIILLFALVIDRCFGEPKRWHPLSGFGSLASSLERRLNRSSIKSVFGVRLIGAVAVLILLIPFFFLASYLSSTSWIFDLIVLTLAIGWQSLREHGIAVRNALLENNLPLARQKVAMIVSRDTMDMSEKQICDATLESLLENGSDAIFAAIFWFAVAGAPGVIIYRLSNTLDAMWGYKTRRFLHFGWAAARLDDVLNYVPARLTAISYFLASRNSNAIKCWLLQAKNWKSPNAGPVMAAGAGGLNIQLGGSAIYNSIEQVRPILGSGRNANTSDIHAALKMIFYGILIWCGVIVTIELLLAYANI